MGILFVLDPTVDDGCDSKDDPFINVSSFTSLVKGLTDYQAMELLTGAIALEASNFRGGTPVCEAMIEETNDMVWGLNNQIESLVVLTTMMSKFQLKSWCTSQGNPETGACALPKARTS